MPHAHHKANQLPVQRKHKTAEREPLQSTDIPVRPKDISGIKNTELKLFSKSTPTLKHKVMTEVFKIDDALNVTKARKKTHINPIKTPGKTDSTPCTNN